jgi:hypothetical protein
MSERVDPRMPLFTEVPNGDLSGLPGYYEMVTLTESQGYSAHGVPQRGPVKYAVRPLAEKERALLEGIND